MKQFEFSLYLIDKKSRHPCSLEKWIAAFNSKKPILVDIEDSFINFSYDAPIVDHWCLGSKINWNLGPIDWLVPQFGSCLDLLREGKNALVRSAVLDGEGVPFILFSPEGKSIKISLIVFHDSHIEGIFPSGPLSKNSNTLYKHLSENRQRIFTRIQTAYKNIENPDEFVDQVVDKETLMARIESIVKQGNFIICNNPEYTFYNKT